MPQDMVLTQGPKISNTLFHIFFFFLPKFCFYVFVSQNTWQNSNSVDYDQTVPSGAVWSESTLFAYAILSETLSNRILGQLLNPNY